MSGYFLKESRLQATTITFIGLLAYEHLMSNKITAS